MIQNNALTLIKILTGIYYCQLAVPMDRPSIDELREEADNVRLEGKDITPGSDEYAASELKKTIEWMSAAIASGVTISRPNLLQRLKLDVGGDHYFYSAIDEGLVDYKTQEEIQGRILEISSELKHAKKQDRLKRLISSANRELNFSASNINTSTYVKELIVELETHMGGLGDADTPASQTDILNFNSIEDIERCLERMIVSETDDGLMKTGLRGLDMMFNGGLRRGEYANHGALPGSYKSGILIDYPLSVAEFNDPYIINPGMKPLILRISLENQMPQDLRIVYSKLHERKYGEDADLRNLNVRQAARSIMEHYSQRGWYYTAECHNALDFSVYDLFKIIMRYWKSGYEIALISLDYPKLMAENTVGERLQAKILKTVENIRLFCFPRGITVVAAHQISTEAITKKRDIGDIGFTGILKDGGYYEECKGLSQKFDLEVVQHVFDHADGNRYIMFERAKHRAGEKTPAAHKKAVYAFQRYGGIVPDYDREDLLLRKVPSLNLGDLSEF